MSAAWLLLGIGMGFGLYDAAFATLGRIYGSSARGAITGITLIAGFASTIGWPLSSLGLETIGWRDTCFAWAVAHIVIGLPLNTVAAARRDAGDENEGPVVKPQIPIDRAMVLLAFAFAAAWTVTSAMAAHFPRIVEASGATPAQAIAAGMLIGPAQVAARMLEASLLNRFHPLVSACLACLTHPIGACVIGIFGGRRRGCLRPAARRRQRHPDHRARHGAACHLRPRELRLPARADRRGVARLPGVGAACIRPPDRAVGKAGARRIDRPLRCGIARVDGLAPIECRCRET